MSSAQPSKLSKSDFCHMQQGLDRQPKCGGCRKIELLIRYWITSRDSGGRTSFRSKPELIHNDYAELNSCSQQCVTCRIIRRGFLMNQPTMIDVNNLESCPNNIWATVVGAGLPNMTLHISLSRDLSQSTVVTFSQENATIPDEITLPLKGDTKAVYSQIRTWAETCHKDHPECGNLNWSNENPTRLLHIISSSQVQLVDSREETGLVKYAALSYCWGNPDDIATQRGRTTDDDLAARKAQPFPICDLPATIRDAITLALGYGLEYVWIDSVCIIQGNADDWLAEAHRMHEVYANAYFTICAVSVDTASAGLFHTRKAWQYRAERCRLAAQQISSRTLSCRELVEGSTWSNRAWTLQEEQLSPRILYWTPQRLYWSCAKCFEAEGDGLSGLLPSGPMSESPLAATTTSAAFAQNLSFPAATRSGHDLHDRWFDMIENFTRRKLTNPSDKFAAISGIAMRYQNCRAGDQYLAGLWKDTFAQDLAWRTPVHLLEVNARPVDEDGAVIPSWSWASLPMGHPAIMRRRQQSDGEQSKRCQLVEPELQNTEKRTISTPITRSLVVVGRMRPLIGADSQKVDWSDISVIVAEGQEKFSFVNYVADDIHSVDLSRGLVLVYEAHRDETFGHIDYLTDADKVYQGVSKLECLELGKSEMLLLEPCLDGIRHGNARQQVKLYRRIGVSWKFRTDFFESATETKIELI